MPLDGEVRLQTIDKLEPMLHPRRYKGLHGGRGGMKSHFFAELMIEESVLDPDMRAVCVREHQATLKHSSKQTLEDKIRMMGVQDHFEVQDKIIHILEPFEHRTRQAGYIMFQGMKNHTADSIKSLEGFKRAWIEEAQRLSQTSWNLLYPTIRAPNSEIWASWNPKFPTDPIDKTFRKEFAGDPDVLVIETSYRDNPWFPDTLRKDMERDKRRDPDKYQHIWLGGYDTKSDARVFKNWSIGDGEEIDYLAARCKRFYQGADWGFSVDPTVLIVCFILERRLYVYREFYKVGLEIDYTPKFFDQWEGAKKWPMIGDCARPETISYMQRNGYSNLRASLKGPGSIEDGIEFLKGYDIVVHPDCTHTIDELTMYRFEEDDLTGEILPKLVDKKNHVIDALRYSVEPLRRAKGGFL